MKKPTLFIILLLLGCELFPQYIPVTQHPNDVYSFLDEFSTSTNEPVRPLGRSTISELLQGIDTASLNSRQKKELEFYLRDYNKEVFKSKNFSRRIDLFYYVDSSFSITINPIAGADMYSNENGFEYHWWNGVESYAKIGRWGIFGSLRDNHESSVLTAPDYMNQNQGGSSFKKFRDGRMDYEDIRGGVTYSWKTGSIGLVKDNFTWATNYNGSNVFSGRPPAFVNLDLQIRPVSWLGFRYIHGWLNSEVVDSARSFNYTSGYGDFNRRVYHNKFLAANLFTLFPVKGLSMSAGNSIIYDNDHVHPGFLIPVMFFKAVDHWFSSGIKNMNSQMFFDISSRNIDHVHLYSTLFIDELAIERIFKKEEHNFASFKGGVRINNLLLRNSFAGFEYTITNALTFRHDVITTTFESNRFNMGHYLTDNAKELYLTAGYRPFRNMVFQLSFTDALKGPDHSTLGTLPRAGLEPFEPVVWKSRSVLFTGSWQPLNDLYIRLSYERRNVTGEIEYLERYTPEFWWGKTGTFSFGVNYGF